MRPGHRTQVHRESGDADSLTNSILTAALRIVAARLSGDALPERTAETQLARALAARDAWLAEWRKRHRPLTQKRDAYEGPRGPAGTAAVWRDVEAMRKRARPMPNETEAAYLAQVERSIHRIIKRHAAEISDPARRQITIDAWTALFIRNGLAGQTP